MAPLQLVIKDGIVYQLPQKSFKILWYPNVVNRIEEAAVYKAPVYPTRNEYNIYIEYLWKELAEKNPFKLFDKWFRKAYKIKKKDHYYVDKYFTNPVFKASTPKMQGKLVFGTVVLPTACVLYFVLSRTNRALNKLSPINRRAFKLMFILALFAAVYFGKPYYDNLGKPQKSEPRIWTSE